MSTTRQELLAHFDGLLQPERFKDYGPNGLQVEGRGEIRRIVSGVTASRALIEAAIEAQADAIFVHHGLFWRGMDGRITGWLKERIRLLLAHDINLFAYHLPLDAHPQWGNNAQLGVQLGLEGQATFGEQNLGWMAAADFADAAALGRHVEQALGARLSAWGESACAPITPFAALPGARAARKVSSRPRLPLGPMPSSRARFPSRRRIWPGKRAWPSWRQATMPRSATARRPWRARWHWSWGWSTVSSRSTIRPDAGLLVAHYWPAQGARPFAASAARMPGLPDPDTENA